jgi:hypothetical protein
MPTEPLVTTDLLIADAVFILQCVDQRQRDGESTQLIDVRTALSPAVTLAFSDYLRFLRRFGYATFNVDDRTLALTARGRSALTESATLVSQLSGFFPDKLHKPIAEVMAHEDGLPQETPPAAPPPTDPPRQPPTHPPPSVEPQSSEPIYVRGDKLGAGPAGTVFRALHTTLGLEVAIKELSGPMLSRVRSFDPGRLRDTVGQQVRLHHPAVVTVYDLDLSGTVPVAAMELCEAGNLRGFLALPGVRQQTQAILRAFAQILDALGAAHEAGFAHGNLKAENVLFDRFGNARLTDFGLASLRDPDSNPDAALMPYLAPEQVESGALQPTSAGDVYSVGVLMYEALVNRAPNRRAPFPQKLEGELPSALAWVLQHMVAEQPSDRYRGAPDCLRDYLRAVGGDPRIGEVGKVPFSTRPLVPELKPRGPLPAAT